jgi:arabinogalactan endo-1,4-beta-galactosidase
MLWQDSRASVSATNFQRFAYMISSGRNAANAVFPAAKVIVHITNGENTTTARGSSTACAPTGPTGPCAA